MIVEGFRVRHHNTVAFLYLPQPGGDPIARAAFDGLANGWTAYTVGPKGVHENETRVCPDAPTAFAELVKAIRAELKK